MAKKKKTPQEITGADSEWTRRFWSDIADQHDYIIRGVDKDLSGLRDREIKSWPIVELSDVHTPHPAKHVDRSAPTGRKFKRPYSGMYEVGIIPEEFRNAVTNGYRDMMDGDSEIYSNLVSAYPLGELPLSFAFISPKEFWYIYGYEDAMEEMFYDQLSRDE